MPNSLRLLCILAALAAPVWPATADVPNETSYQGLLFDPTGQAVPGPVDLEIRIFDAPSGGTLLYREDHPNLALSDGVFQIRIGTGAAPSGSWDAQLFADPNRWLELVVDSEVLEPRQPFGSVAFAFQAGDAASLGSIPPSAIVTQTDLSDVKTQLDQLQQQVQELLCGNGRLDGIEECDDGNRVSGDGCDGICHVEFCGDAVLQPALGEECDDGNAVPGDGCDGTCAFEFVCGDGIVDPNEQCDDGLLNSDTEPDACRTDCRLPRCGDSVVDSGEACDDGNNANEDGCSFSCVIEFCGDGITQGGLNEDCDDGNNVSGDGCSATCQFEQQVAPADARFNNPLVVPLDNTASTLDFVSFPLGDTEDRVRYQVTGMNPNPSLSGGRARLVISASCFGNGTDQIQFFTGGQTFTCGQTLVDREVTADSNTGQITITAVGGTATYVQWVLTGTATRTN